MNRNYGRTLMTVTEAFLENYTTRKDRLPYAHWEQARGPNRIDARAAKALGCGQEICQFGAMPIVRGWLSAFVVAAAVCSVADVRGAGAWGPNTEPCEVRLGLLPWLESGENSVRVAAAALLAVHHIRVGDYSVVSFGESRRPLCTNITYRLASTAGTPSVAVSRSLDWVVRKEVDVLLGLARSAESGPMSIVAGSYDIPVISYGASSTTLSDKAQYPLFLRTCPADDLFATVAARLCAELQWSTVAVLHLDDLFGSSYAQGFAANAPKLGITIATLQRFSSLDQNSISLAIDGLKASGARVFVCITFPTDLVSIMSKAESAGLIGEGYQWISPGGSIGMPEWMASTLTTTNEEKVRFRQQMNGWISLGIVAVSDERRERWDKVWDQTDASVINHPMFRTSDATIKKPCNAAGCAYMYDAVWAAVLGVSMSVLKGGDKAANMRSLEFEGLSGTVKFEPTGDRWTNRIEVSISNWYAPNGGAGNDAMVDQKIGSFQKETNFTWLKDAEPVWAGSGIKGWKHIPRIACQEGYLYSDNSGKCERICTLDVGVVVSDRCVAWVIFMPSVMVPILAIIGAVAYVYTLVQVKRGESLWQIRSSDINFELPPGQMLNSHVLGRGTFGLVLAADYHGTMVAVKRAIPPLRRHSGQVGSSQACDLEASLPSAPNLNSSVSCDKDPEASKGRWGRAKIGLTSFDRFTRTDSFESGGFNATSSTLSIVASLPPTPQKLKRQSTLLITRLDPTLDVGLVPNNGDSWNKTFVPSNDSQTGESQGRWGSYEKFLYEKILPGNVGAKLKRRRMHADFMQEMRTLSRLRHPCVITVLGACLDCSEPLLVMELMEHGSLADLIANESVELNAELLLPMFRDVSQGLRFLHSAVPPVVHGDIKAGNMLVSSSFHVKVADFGLSTKRSLGIVGTPQFIAPEILRGKTCITMESDVYSFGIMLSEVYGRQTPYDPTSPELVMRRVKLCEEGAEPYRPKIPPGCPVIMVDMMKVCWHEESAFRPTFQDLDKRFKTMDIERMDRGSSRLCRANSRERLLHEVFPPHVAEALTQGRQVEPMHKEEVTIFFSDIVGFTNISSALDAAGVSRMLHRLYTKFDELSRKHDCFKVETIGDAYMAVTNLIKDQSTDHAARLARFALEAIKEANETLISEADPSMGGIKIRVGLHSGPVVASVVGTMNPRFCLFGDTVNVSSRMESNSVEGMVHVSKKFATVLVKQDKSVRMKRRGVIDVKGKGRMETYWVVGDSTYHKDDPVLLSKFATEEDIDREVDGGNHTADDPFDLPGDTPIEVENNIKPFLLAGVAQFESHAVRNGSNRSMPNENPDCPEVSRRQQQRFSSLFSQSFKSVVSHLARKVEQVPTSLRKVSGENNGNLQTSSRTGRSGSCSASVENSGRHRTVQAARGPQTTLQGSNASGQVPSLFGSHVASANRPWSDETKPMRKSDPMTSLTTAANANVGGRAISELGLDEAGLRPDVGRPSHAVARRGVLDVIISTVDDARDSSHASKPPSGCLAPAKSNGPASGKPPSGKSSPLRSIAGRSSQVFGPLDLESGPSLAVLCELYGDDGCREACPELGPAPASISDACLNHVQGNGGSELGNSIRVQWDSSWS